MADQDPIGDGGGGGFLSGEIMGIPTWVFIAGVGAVVVFLYLRKRSSSAADSAALQGPIGGGVTGQVAGGAVDPYTGNLIDPYTGQPYTAVGSNPSQTSDLSAWITTAERDLISAGYSPAAIAQAIYDYTNGNQLSAQEAGIINKALQLAGFPPVNLPFLGTPPPNPKPVPPPKIKPPLPIHLPIPTPVGNGHKLLPLPTPGPVLLSKITAGGAKLVQAIRTPQFGPNAGYYLSSNGGVFAVGGAPFLGSYFSLPSKDRNIPNRRFTSLQLLPHGGYTLVSSTGEHYSFPAPAPKKAA